MFAELTSNLILISLFGLIVWVLWKSTFPDRIFRILVTKGEVKATSGKVTPAFLQFVKEIAAENEIIKGSVSGYPQGQFIRLEFSSEFKAASRQRLRNWWGINGRKAPRSSEAKR